MAELLKCPSCGAEIPKGANFCTACGKELVPHEASKEEIPTFADKYNGYSKILGILSIFIFGWVLGPLAIYYGAKARALDSRKGTAGILLGIIGLVVWIAGVIMTLIW